MNKRIYKYVLDTFNTTLELPKDSKIISLCKQGNGIGIVIYALVDTETVLFDKYEFLVYPTGATLLQEDSVFLGTVSFANATLIYHVFYRLLTKDSDSEINEDEKNVFAISGDELKNKPNLGKTAKCNGCNKYHDVKFGKDKDGNETTFAYITCPQTKNSYMVGIDGKQIF